ncbi:magnesium transporter CorA family protein [Methanospirillum hungatei]|uniref:magnesium transporter CorA family protein n=1 Tax=Methanospirillum hungatei TaxID=2203 RepID=UPI0026EFDFF5|nr:magnesium transporter CorA family protein [Methanospirillum hungatei]MCA1915063.1 magnesium transporter CorA family protein [Methanospirillum hungatei]
MISAYITTQDGLIPVDSWEDGCWIKVVNPTEKEISLLVEKYGVWIEFFTDPLDVDERARFEVDEGNILILIRSPRREPEEAAIPYITLPIGIILTANVIITVTLTEVDVLDEFLSGWVRNFDTRTRTRFALQICYRTALRFLRYLKDINRMSSQIEMNLHRSTTNDLLLDLFNLHKSLVFFTTSLRSNSLMVEKFSYSSILEMSDEEHDLYEEMVIENKQALEMANIYTSIIMGMTGTFASIINNNVNVVMKLLTSITILISLPTLIASIYGMNVTLPLQDDPFAFLFIMFCAVAASAIGLFVLVRWKVL